MWPRGGSQRGLALILILYLALATTYSIVVPIGRGADEWAHYWYAQFIAQHGRLPANPAEREAAGYKSDWPPLYHLFAAGLTFWIETGGPPTFKYRAENIRRQLVPALGPEAILHTEDERFPWQQEILIWHLGRFLSIGFTLGTLIVTYFIALEVFTGTIRNPFALAATAVLAFNPRFLFTSMLFSYDSLMLLLASLFLWLVIRIAKGYYSGWGYWGLGALAGLALMTKYLAAPLVLVIVVVALMRAGEHRLSATRLTRRAFRPLIQAALAFILVTAPWFGYLIRTFNEVETYGPVLGTLAPLIRGDGSDRTVEQIFAWLSSGQAPPPAPIDRQSYTAWQILAELPTTFWGNPLTRPYPLNWFILVMTAITILAGVGLFIGWRASVSTAEPGDEPASRINTRLLLLLLLHCALPLPFMFIRLFGARDALEAVQGRHILFLSGPAFAILLVWGIRFTIYDLRFRIYDLVRSLFGERSPLYTLRFTLSAVVALLLIGAVGQLIFMKRVYPPLLPVRTTSYEQVGDPPLEIMLPGGARLIDYSLEALDHSLQVALIWQGGASPPPEDYQMELALVDAQGQAQAGWLGYQTQAHYPTRTWEPGDVIRDEGWLPLTGLPAGDYELRLRLLGQADEVVPWQTLTAYRKAEGGKIKDEGGGMKDESGDRKPKLVLWSQGEVMEQPPTLHERETAQFTLADPQSAIPNPQLIGSDGVPRLPAATGPTWANFIIQPDWPAGDYRLQNGNEVVLRVAPNDRNFAVPAEMTVPLEVDFAGQIKLLGYHLPTRRVQPGEGLPVTLYWQGLRWMGQSFVIFNRLLDNQQVAWGGYDRLARENYSTLLWVPGEIVTDGFAVPVAGEAPPGIYRLSLGWYQLSEGEAQSLPLINPETGQPTDMTAVTIGPIKVGAGPPELVLTEASPHNKVDLVLGRQIKLLGFDVTAPNESEVTGQAPVDEETNPDVKPLSPHLFTASPITLTFYWQPVALPQSDYTVFLHLRQSSGEIVAQNDRPPAKGAYPTSLWDTGEIIRDEITLSFDPLEPGQYELVTGMYDPATGVRLAVEGSPDHTVLLQSFEVE